MDDAVQTDHSEKTVSSDLIRGHINTIILRALYDGDKYGYEIIAEIERKSHGQYSLKQPSLYSALKRLEKDGYVTSYWGGSVGGGRRKYFSLTEAGKAISEQNQSEWEYSRTVIDSLISDKDFDFSNPAPSLVNMRVLKNSTSRVPRGEGGEEEVDYLPSFDDDEFDQIEESYQEKLNEQRAAFDEEMRSRSEEMAKEYDWREQELAAREQALGEQRQAFESRSESMTRAQDEREQALAAREDAVERQRLTNENAERSFAAREEALTAREKEIGEAAARSETLQKEYGWREQELSAREQALGEQRRAFESRSESVTRAQDEREQALAAREEELGQRQAELEERSAEALSEQRTALETQTLQAFADQRAALDEEMRTRTEQYLRERDWREQELAAREQALVRKRGELDERNALLLKEYDWREREIGAREQALAQRRSELDARSETLSQENARREQELDARAQEVEEQRLALEQQTEREATEQEEALRAQIASLEYRLQENEAALEEAQRLADERLINPEAEEQREKIAQLEQEKDELSQQLEEQKKSSEAQLEEERKRAEALLEDEKKRSEAALEDERQRNEFLLETERHRSESAIAAERNNYNNHLENVLAQERARHEAELKAQEERIIAEQEEIYRRQEHALLQRNYLDLLNTPSSRAAARGDYSHYNKPAPPQGSNADEPPQDYRSIVYKMYSNAVGPENAVPAQSNARSLDGIDFTDLQTRAEKDGIRIQTSGGKPGRFEQETESLVNKGKALFLSGIAFCAFLVAMGAVLLGLSASVALPAFYPYLLWGVGFAVLLVTGLAYANRYGARSLRKTGPIVLNVCIAYILLVIVTLIIALAARVDFNAPIALASWVIIPVIAYLGIIIFGVAYYLQMRPKRK